MDPQGTSSTSYLDQIDKKEADRQELLAELAALEAALDVLRNLRAQLAALISLLQVVQVDDGMIHATTPGLSEVVEDLLAVIDDLIRATEELLARGREALRSLEHEIRELWLAFNKAARQEADALWYVYQTTDFGSQKDDDTYPVGSRWVVVQTGNKRNPYATKLRRDMLPGEIEVSPPSFQPGSAGAGGKFK